MNPPDVPLSPDERAAYEAFAHSATMDRHAMSLAMLTGLGVALAIGPRRLTFERCLPWIWDRRQGLRPPDFADADQAAAVTALVLRQHGSWAVGIDAAHDDPFSRLFGAQGRVDVIDFCQGFMVAVNLGFPDWAPLLVTEPKSLVALTLLGQTDPQALLGLNDAALESLTRVVAVDLESLREHWRSHPAMAPAPDTMVWEQVRSKLLQVSRPFPNDALVLAHAHRALVAPHLVQELSSMVQDPSAAIDGEWMLQHFAIALLACWRDARAYRPLLAWARLDADIVDALLGDSLHEHYGRALASVCDGDLQPLIQALEDPAVGPWVRIALLEAWKVRVIAGDAPLAQFEQYLLDLGQASAERLRRGETAAADSPEMLDSVASLACDIGAARLLAPVRAWYAEGLLDPQHLDQPFFEREMALPWADRLALARQRRQSYIEDVADEIAWWASYTEDEGFDAAPAPVTYVRDGPKIGRNERCPCGSGLKYKKCHGAH